MLDEGLHVSAWFCCMLYLILELITVSPIQAIGLNILCITSWSTPLTPHERESHRVHQAQNGEQA